MSRYVVITTADMDVIWRTLKAAKLSRLSPDLASVARIVDRFTSETGADIAEMVETLKKLEVCAACSIEGQAEYCSALEAQKQGRRLRRLLERAAS